MLRNRTVIALCSTVVLVAPFAWSATGLSLAAPYSQGAGSLGSVSLSSTNNRPAPVVETLGHVPLSFIENVGQFDPQARFQAPGGHTTLWLAEDGLWVTVFRGTEDSGLRTQDSGLRTQNSELRPGARGVSVKLTFPGANLHPVIEGFRPVEASVSYLIGNEASQWHQNVPVWAGVRYTGLYPGLDLELTGETGQLQLHLVATSCLLPADDPGRVSLSPAPRVPEEACPPVSLSSVRLRVEGADGLDLDGNYLRLSTAAGTLAWPLLDVVTPDASMGLALERPVLNGNEVSTPFAGDRSSAPSAPSNTSDLLLSTYLGGTGTDTSRSIALDGSGNIYVTGYTTGSFPTTSGAFDTTFNGITYDPFVTKLNSSGSALVYSTYLGGSSDDYAFGIKVDSTGSAYVTGYTNSSNFPTQNGYDTTSNGGSDVFVTKLSSAGNTLSYSTYLGGTLSDYAFSIALDASNNAYVTGFTGSSTFPATTGAYDTTFNSLDDAFISKFNPALSGTSSLVYSTFVGTSNTDLGQAIAVDSSGAAYITGQTFSSSFPLRNGYQTLFGGVDDAFMTKINPAGGGSADLVYSTYLGGSSEEWGYGIAVDSSNNAYVTGWTTSSFYPTSSAAYDRSYNGGKDIFVTKLNPGLSGSSSLVYSTYLGGTGDEPTCDFINEDRPCGAIAVDSSGVAYVTGNTASSDFPVVAGSYDTTFSSSSDAFVTKLNTGGTALTYNTFLGGSGNDYGYGIALSSSTAYITGMTGASDFPTTAGAYDTTWAGFASDAYVSKLGFTLFPTATPTNTPTPTTTFTPSSTPTATPAVTNTPSDTPTDTMTPTDTPTSSPTTAATDTPTPTATGTPTYTPTDTPTSTVTDTPTSTPTTTSTNTPTNMPTHTPTDTPTDTPTSVPTNTPTNTPTDTLTSVPTDTPTNTPTNPPTDTPTNTPTPSRTVTPTRTTSPSPSPSPSQTSATPQKPTFTPTPSTSCVLTNGDFEGGPGLGWTESSGAGNELINGLLPHTGNFSARLCDYNGCTDSIQQSIQIVSNCSISYWWYLTSSDSTTVAHDFQKVELYRLDGTLVVTLRTRNNIQRRGVWLQDSISLNTYAGQNLLLRFTSTTDTANPSAFYVDDLTTTSPPPSTSTPAPSPTPVPGNVVVNPGFESGPGVGWTESSGNGFEVINTSRPRNGAYSAYLCGYDGCNEYIQQSITIPSGAGLSYWWYLASDEGTTTAHDYLKVELYRTNGTLLATLRTRNNTVRRDAWLQDTIGLSTYAGQTVLLRFTATTDVALPTSFFIDDVSVR